MVLNRHIQHSLTRYARVSRPREVARIIPYYAKRFNSQNPQNTGQVNPDPLDQDAGDGHSWKSTAFKIMETAATTFTSIAILGCVLLSFADPGSPLAAC